MDDGDIALDIHDDACNESSTEVLATSLLRHEVLAADSRPGHRCSRADDCNDIRAVESAKAVGDR